MNKERVLLREGLIRNESEGRVLLAGKCTGCGQVYFPKRNFCPECRSKEMETILLSEVGELYTYTIVNMPSAHCSPPYIIGWLEFPEGVRVFGQIEITENTELKIGMKMRAAAGSLWEDENKEVIAYKFVPDSKK